MVRITNSEQISLALKARLDKLKAKKKAEQSANANTAQSVEQSSSDPLQELALEEGLEEKDSGRALVRAILGQEFGEEIAADPRFEKVVQKVSVIIESGEEGRALIEAALNELRDRS